MPHEHGCERDTIHARAASRRRRPWRERSRASLFGPSFQTTYRHEVHKGAWTVLHCT